jgi:YD repeat-containing protein
MRSPRGQARTAVALAVIGMLCVGGLALAPPAVHALSGTISHVASESASLAAPASTIDVDQPDGVEPGDVLVAAVASGVPAAPAPLLSESFSGSNGAGWDAGRWSTGLSGSGAVDIQSNAGRIDLDAGTSWGYGLGSTSSQHSDAEVIAAFTVGSEPDGAVSFWLRASSTWDSGAQQFTDGYKLTADVDSDAVRIELVYDTWDGAWLAGDSFTFDANTTYRVRFRADGSLLAAKVWVDGTSEPSAWTLDATDDQHASGRAAVSAHVYDSSAFEATIDDYELTEVDGSTTSQFSESFSGTNGAGWDAGRWSTGLSGSGAVDIQSNAGRIDLDAGTSWGYGLGSTSSQHSDAEVTATFTVGSEPDAAVSFWLRASSTWDSGAQQFTDGYKLTADVDSDAVRIELVYDTWDGAWLAGNSFTFDANTTYRVRFRAEGTLLAAKVWVDGTTEPSNWTLVTTDDMHASGRAAVSANVYDSAALEATIDNYDVSAPVVAPATVVAPSGFELETEQTNGTTRLTTWTHVVESGDPSSWQFDLSAPAFATATIVAYRGVDPAGPVDVSATQANTSTTTHTAPSVTTTGPDRALVTVVATDAVTALAPASGALERVDQAGAVAGAASIGVADEDVLVAGATGVRSPSSTVASASVTASIALIAGEVVSGDSATFEFTGATETWEVPADVTEIQVDVYGAQGGGQYGGLGGHTRAVIDVTPSETLSIAVGGQPTTATGGFGGGADGGMWTGEDGTTAWGGGGASDVRRGGTGLANRVVVAGGGGGAGERHTSWLGTGGSGGGLEAGAGDAGCGAGGGGGSQTAGGSGSFRAAGGDLGVGGAALGYYTDGGGGGGGYYGGGGGGTCGANDQPGGGGGGGSSFAVSTARGVQHQRGVHVGAGRVVLRWPPTTPETTPPAPDSETFAFTGGPQFWTVPEGLTAIQVDAYGAQGGGNYGGLGGRVQAVLPVTPGQTLQLNVGGQPSGAAGGFGAGGPGGSWTGEDGTTAFGGGGASDIRIAGVTVADRVLVAGGGGGAGERELSWSGPGGSGGGLDGAAGNDGWGPGGGGGSQGAGGSGSFRAGGGGLGVGGTNLGYYADGGGGGGGYYGGGAGGVYPANDVPGGGGGGGSSYTSGVATGVTHSRGVHTGNGVITVSWPPASPTPEPPASDSETFSYTGGPQWWTVPEDVYAIHAEVQGAQGGASLGGLGGSASATIAVTPGQRLQVNVGEQPSGAPGGFGGGAAGGSWTSEDGTTSFGGGGASDIRKGTTLADRVLVAGGGGGASERATAGNGSGGDGGGLEGEAGDDGWGPGGGGGTQSAGGSGSFRAGAGALGVGGVNFGYYADGGGGGGGYYGGGAGGVYPANNVPGGGGGGGSSYAAPETLDATTETGVNSGHGEVTISWPVILLPERSFGFASYGDFVNGVHLGSGNFVEQVTDISLATVGPDLGLSRTYNSLDTGVGLFGKGWSSTYEISIAEDVNGDVMVAWPDGRRDLYIPDGVGGYETPAGFGSTLAADLGGGWTLTSKDDSKYGFDANGGLISIEDKYGRSLDLVYGVDGLESVTDPASGRSLTLDYTGSRVTSVTTSAVAGPGYSGSLTWNYVYSGDLLTKVCDARDNNVSTGVCTRYSYASDRLTEILLPEGNAKRTISYAGSGRVAWIENGTDDRYTFTYGMGITQIADPRAHVSSYFYDAHHRTTRLVDPMLGVTTYEYDGTGFRTKVIDATGRVESMTYDETGNMLSSTNGAGGTAHFAYDVDGNLTARRDERSSSATDDTFKTTFTYNAAGDKLTETSPPTAEHTSGVTKTWTYTTGSEDDGWGTVPAGLLRTENPGQGNDTTYEYDSNGDLRRKTDAAGLETEYTYDGFGRVLTTTTDWGAAVPRPRSRGTRWGTS